MRKIVLTGGPGVGKSSIIHCLQEMGYSVREEVFTKIFAQAQNAGKFDDAFLYSKKLIQELISAQIELENREEANENLFLDRSCIDIWGFARNMGITLDPEERKSLESRRYDLVFIVEPMPREFYDQNAIRRQSYEESLVHHQANLENAIEYLKLQGEFSKNSLVHVPFSLDDRFLSVKERTQFVLDQVRTHGMVL
jgi:predicted ATPase